ncbi:TPA: DUF1799 domain-containing protein [Enterobacter cloacae]|nr:DUF1799 domain-containing protein [Enterobacter cloacae]
MPEILVNSAILESYNVFADLETQWVASPSGGVLGLNYAAIPLVLKVHDVKDHTQTFRDIRIMEAAARTAINNRESA